MKNKTKSPRNSFKSQKNRGKIGNPSMDIHDHSLFILGTGAAIKDDEVRLVLWAQNSPFSEMMWSYKFLKM